MQLDDSLGYGQAQAGVVTLYIALLASEEPVEDITLIPMGAARIRLSAFPVIDNESGRPWASPPEPPVTQPERKKALPRKNK